MDGVRFQKCHASPCLRQTCQDPQCILLLSGTGLYVLLSGMPPKLLSLYHISNIITDVIMKSQAWTTVKIS